jgi:hypothetical protein
VDPLDQSEIDRLVKLYVTIVKSQRELLSGGAVSESARSKSQGQHQFRQFLRRVGRLCKGQESPPGDRGS